MTFATLIFPGPVRQPLERTNITNDTVNAARSSALHYVSPRKRFVIDEFVNLQPIRVRVYVAHICVLFGRSSSHHYTTLRQ